jgi:7-carboxy-7-deazaguanine synthase
MHLNVSEIFYSIQGESLYAGLPCVFIRLAGCNLKCAYCDTRYAHDGGTAMSLPEILGRVAGFSCPLVEITGGEPLLQDETPALADALLAKGYRVLVETNGSIDINRVSKKCVRIVDIKCPGSGHVDQNDLANLKRLSPMDQLKFVLTDRMDYEFARDMIFDAWQQDTIPASIPPPEPMPISAPVPILFSPVHGCLKPAALAEWILGDHLNVRLHLQMHKILWPEAHRGR